MIRRLSSWLIATVFSAAVGGVSLSLFSTTDVLAAVQTTTCKSHGSFLTFPVWYKGLNPVNPNNPSLDSCDIVSPEDLNTNPAGEPSNGLSNFIWRVVLNVIEIALNVVGYVSVAFIVYGGFLLMVARGEPENITKARLSIRDAAVGLIISFGSVAIINLIVDPAMGIF